MLEPVVFLVDDDSAVRDSLSLLIHSIGLKVAAFERPQQFLDQYHPQQVGCLLLDIRMPNVSGLTFQEALNDIGFSIPIIFITGHGDVAQCSRAFRAGAADFLTKPIDEHELIESVQKAIATSVARQAASESNAAERKKLALLTPREREVLAMVADGMSSKMIARALDLSLRTVESYRAKVFEKLEVNSLAECVKIQLAARNPLNAAPAAG
ncbi:MAG: response regulator [Pseudomonadota bacterium]